MKNENVLFVAPTNELIHQHANDIQEFVEEHELNFCVAEVTGQQLREWRLLTILVIGLEIRENCTSLFKIPVLIFLK